MLRTNLEQLYEQLKHIAYHIEHSKEDFINSTIIGGSATKNKLVEQLSKKCDELRDKDFELLEFINRLFECEDESELETILCKGEEIVNE